MSDEDGDSSDFDSVSSLYHSSHHDSFDLQELTKIGDMSENVVQLKNDTMENLAFKPPNWGEMDLSTIYHILNPNNDEDFKD